MHTQFVDALSLRDMFHVTQEAVSTKIACNLIQLANSYNQL